MRKTVLSLFAFCAFAFQSVAASPEGHQKAAEELLGLMKTTELFKDTFLPVFSQQIEQNLSSSGVAAAKIEQIIVAGGDLADKISGDPEFHQKLLEIYKSSFTEDELNGLVAFYRTPLGKKALAELPALAAKGAAIGEALTAKHMPEFQAEIERIMMQP